ncbi:MAG TPA: PAS domain-containing protein [Gemmatimonadaceae bacterium]
MHGLERLDPTSPVLVAVTEAVAGVLVAFVVARLTEPVVHPSAFLVFFGVVALTAWRRGWWPALLASALSVAALALAFGREESVPLAVTAGALRLAMYVAVSRFVSSLRTWRDAARKRESELGELNALLAQQALELQGQVLQSRALAAQLAESNAELAALARRSEADRESAISVAQRREGEMAVIDLLLATSSVGFAHWDRDLRFVRVNARLAEMTGIAAEAHIGRRVEEVAPALAPVLVPMLRRALEGGQPVVDVEVVGQAPDHPGSGRSWLASYYPLRTADGDIHGVGAVVVDITERKQIEARLRHAQKMEAVGRLAGGIAHDFNNILTAIKSYTQFLGESLQDADPRAQDVREIAAAADRAAALTRQLLAFGRRQMMQPRVVDLNLVVGEMERMLTRLIGEDIELVTRLHPTLGQVRADPSQLEQVVLNLAVNARDAMPHGGVLMLETANVCVEPGGADAMLGITPGPYVVLTVRDTGIGMSPETMSHLFEPFFTTKAPGIGTGLGLATVYGIVKQSGGDVRASSDQGRGTTVEVFLPRLPGSPVESAASRRGGMAPSGNETVLLVEDDEMLRPLVRRVLEKQGFRVLEARHGAEALRAAAAHRGPLHLLITDVVMPEMGGRELAQRIAVTRPGTPVLYISGYTDDAVLRQGMLESGSAFLQKPFTPADLLARAREILAGAC